MPRGLTADGAHFSPYTSEDQGFSSLESLMTRDIFQYLTLCLSVTSL